MAGLADKTARDVVDLCARLIDAPSVSGDEAAAVEVARAYMLAHGVDDVRIDRHGSLIGIINGQQPGPTTLFDGHIDTVPADRKAWRRDPYRAVREGDRLYGRGASDMKGAIAAFMTAVLEMAAHSGRRFRGRLAMSLVTYEELFEGVAARAVSEAVRPDCVVIGEATGLKLNTGQRGRAEIVLETEGVPAHSANPEKGVNAVTTMLQWLARLSDLPQPDDPALGRGIAVLTDIVSAPYPGASVLPAACRVTFDRRLVRGETAESVLAPYQQALDLLAGLDAGARGRVHLAEDRRLCYTGNAIEAAKFFPAWYFEPAEPFIRHVIDRFRADGVDVATGTYGFCTNGSHYAGEAGIRTIGYGPSQEHLAHVDDEYVLVSELTAAVQGYRRIIEAWHGGNT